MPYVRIARRQWIVFERTRMSGRQNKKGKSQPGKLDAISGLMGANPVFAKMLMEGMVKGFGADFLGQEEASASQLASVLSGNTPQKIRVRPAKPSAKERERYDQVRLAAVGELDQLSGDEDFQVTRDSKCCSC